MALKSAFGNTCRRISSLADKAPVTDSVLVGSTSLPMLMVKSPAVAAILPVTEMRSLPAAVRMFTLRPVSVA